MRCAEVFNIIRETGIIAIIRGITEKEALFTAEALLKSGIRTLEVTFNTPGADIIIKRMLEEFKNEIVVGAGTVTNTVNAVRAIQCGAEFVLAPNLDPDVVSTVKMSGKLMIPGAFTATEVLRCYELGGDIVKVFPVSSVGPQYIKDLRGPYNNIDMIPVGGVDISNARDFIKAGSIALGVGGSLIKKEFLENNDYKALQELAQRFIEEINFGR